MATDYDPVIIQKLADKLYSQASNAIFFWTLLTLVIGGMTGYAAGLRNDASLAPALALFGAVVSGLIGFSIGSNRAFSLRVQAQIALCHKKIEENTRR